MLGRLVEWSVRNVFLVLLMALAIVAGGIYALMNTPLDAQPDLSDVQVIVFTEYPGQAPQVVEDQVTYPLTSALLATPKSKDVRGFSFFGASFIYVIFEEGTDLYWARSRVLENLNVASKNLPAGVAPALGPDASGVGWVYQYVLQSDRHSLDELRAMQDWYLRYQLTTAPGVAEVASVGGFVRQYSITVDPVRLREFDIPISRVSEVIAESNRDVGGRVIEMAETEYMVRGRGYLRGIEDIESLVLRAEGGAPVLIGDVARVELVPDERRGIVDLDGEGDVVGGIVIARFGENALAVIGGVKDKIAQLASGLPEGVSVQAVYDRSDLIVRAIKTLRTTLLEESLIVALVCLVFLFHARSALVAIVMLPVGVLIAVIAMRMLGMNSNIMSLGGIAISIGVMVDAAIVMIENAHKHIERSDGSRSRTQLIIDACREVGPALFFSLMIITVSFLPVFALEAQEGRLFKPLAFTKTFAMAGGALLSITLVPVLMLLFVRGKIVPERKNPVNRFLIAAYRPVINVVLRHRMATIAIALVALFASVWPASRLGSEFMPTLNEGTLLYMPASLPGMSVTKASELLQQQDRIIKGFPEVESVFGKAGRALTATDPAPLEMFETVINLKPEDQWRDGMTTDKLIAEMDAALKFPGVANSWTMPIKARTDMLAIWPIGDMVSAGCARTLEKAVAALPGVNAASANFATATLQVSYDPAHLSPGAVATAVRNCAFQCDASMPDTGPVAGAHDHAAHAGHGQRTAAEHPADAHAGHGDDAKAAGGPRRPCGHEPRQRSARRGARHGPPFPSRAGLRDPGVRVVAHGRPDGAAAGAVRTARQRLAVPAGDRRGAVSRLAVLQRGDPLAAPRCTGHGGPGASQRGHRIWLQHRVDVLRRRAELLRGFGGTADLRPAWPLARDARPRRCLGCDEGTVETLSTSRGSETRGTGA